MPFIGIGLVHVLLAAFFAVHAVKTGRQLYWVVILFMFPMLGSVVYFFAEYLPSTKIEQQVASAGHKIGRALDPGRDIREAQKAFDVSPTAANQLRLADALFEVDRIDAAADHFDACLAGPFGQEPGVRFGAARCMLARRKIGEAIELLEDIRSQSPGYRSDDVGIMLAHAYWAAGNIAKAEAVFSSLTKGLGPVDVRAEHAIFAIETGDFDRARELQRDIDIAVKTWSRRHRKEHKALLDRLDAAWTRSGRARLT